MLYRGTFEDLVIRCALNAVVDNVHCVVTSIP
jgi:hypothetical protein